MEVDFRGATARIDTEIESRAAKQALAVESVDNTKTKIALIEFGFEDVAYEIINKVDIALGDGCVENPDFWLVEFAQVGARAKAIDIII